MARALSGARGSRKFKAEINVVPYIDVMLVLLVIFMVVAPLSNPGVINLPTAAKSALPPNDYIQIALQLDSAATIGIYSQQNNQQSNQQAQQNKPESVANRTELRQKLQTLHTQYPELPLMVSADKNIKYDEVIQIISEAKKLGIVRVGLATKQ